MKANGQQEAAVMVIHELKTDSLILTQRTSSLREHPGEICFPGGRWQPEDENLYATALRELQEELGIDSSRVKMQKAMQREETISCFIIHPWLAAINSLSPYQLNPAEVFAVLRLPMEEVRKITNYRDTFINSLGENILTCQYTASSHFIWGATARIMKQLALAKKKSCQEGFRGF